MSFGIEETKDVLKFGLEIGDAIGNAVEDKKFDVSDLVHFVAPLLSAEKAFSGIANVPSELADLDENEKNELNKFVEENFDIANDKLEETIERSFKAALEILALVSHLRGN